jgi:cysteinyl-tRNA synthetase
LKGVRIELHATQPPEEMEICMSVTFERERQKSIGAQHSIEVYNTMTKRLEPLSTKYKGQVEMFVCGPTVYNFAHLGHGKTYTQFDFIARYLRTSNYQVTYLQNITDVDDKIIERARATGQPPQSLARTFEQYYLEDMKALHNISVDIYARAHDYIEQIVDQVSRLIEKNYAYRTPDGYYFDLAKFPEYGKLSGRTTVEATDAVSRIDENLYKRNPGDFCLWKVPKEGDPFWDTPLGKGRPGWHIEDTAITEYHFGPQYDIHGGAVDLIFPHHEAEIAQIEAASGLNPMVRHWLHTGFLNMKSEKMSKSSGNFVTIRQVLERIDYRVLRFFFLSHHYRASIEYGEDSIEQARSSLTRINGFIRSIDSKYDDADIEEVISAFRRQFYAYLDKDFDTPRALALLFSFIRDLNRAGGPTGARVSALMREINSLFDFLTLEIDVADSYIEQQIKLRNELRKQKRFEEADAIRLQLQTEGVFLEDTTEGVRWRRN